MMWTGIIYLTIRKNRLLLLGTIIFLLFLLLSCGSVVKNLMGFKNPLVMSIKEVELKEKEYFNDSYFDVYFNKINDTSEIVSVISKSLEGAINVFDKEGNKLCIDTLINCSAIEFNHLQQQSKLTLNPCKSIPNSFTNDISTLDVLLDQTSSFDNKIFNKNEYDYIFVYYWSTFVSSQNRVSKDFEWFEKNVNKLNVNSTIIRVNCDLQERWGLLRGAELPIRFEQNSKGVMALTFGV